MNNNNNNNNNVNVGPHFVRVNGQMMAKHFNEQIRLVGKVLNSSSNSILLLTPDNQQTNVIMISPFPPLQTGKIIEVLGIVNQDLSVSGQSLLEFNDNFDLSLYNEALIVTQAL